MAGQQVPTTLLSPDQKRALFDILSHHETYAEIASFKSPATIPNYGFPFKQGSTDDAAEEATALSAAPTMQMLLTRLVLPFPGMKDLPRDFWSVRVQTLLARLGEAELSESYDKGALGLRKTLATGSSSVLELLARGLLGGLEKRSDAAGHWKSTTYDDGKAADLEKAWSNVLQDLVYGDLIDQLFDHFVDSDDMETYSPTVEASVKHNIYHIASLIHRVFVLSPEGPYLLKLIESVHSLTPYKIIGQTLRIGNAATMINGMMRILLAKLSVTSVTNWLGLTANADDGMNLLQRIISLTLSWDASEFKKGAEKIAKTKNGPSEEMLAVIRQYIEKPRAEHDAVRLASEANSLSIITSIFNASSPHLNKQLTDAQHAQCLEYYSARLSVRDRERITSACCRQTPDMLTQAVKDLVAAWEPLIRSVHTNVQLHVHFEDLQKFIEAFIKTSQAKKGSRSPLSTPREPTLPTVHDYVELLMSHRRLLYKYIHALGSKCPETWASIRAWANDVIRGFRQRNSSSATNGEGEKKSEHAPEHDEPQSISSVLDKLFGGLDADTQASVLTAVDAHAKYLSALNDLSSAKMQRLITAASATSGTGSSDSLDRNAGGPGVYLSRWQALLDETVITPSEKSGATRHGRDVKHTTTMGKTGSGGKKLEVDEAAQKSEVEAPDVKVVVDALAPGFRRAVQQMVKTL